MYCQNLSLRLCENIYGITKNVYFNSLPIDKFLGWSKLKAFADNKVNVTKKQKFAFGRIENIVGKVENAGY